jgi:hypothetical protein
MKIKGGIVVPLMRCTKDGKQGWKFGESGHCYTGKDAKKKAAQQGRAIKAQQAHSGDLMEGVMLGVQILTENNNNESQ